MSPTTTRSRSKNPPVPSSRHPALDGQHRAGHQFGVGADAEADHGGLDPETDAVGEGSGGDRRA